MSTRPQHYCLKWNNYQSHVAEIFTQLLQAESMVDVTLCTEGQKIHAHRIVLSACSPYFQVWSYLLKVYLFSLVSYSCLSVNMPFKSSPFHDFIAAPYCLPHLHFVDPCVH